MLFVFDEFRCFEGEILVGFFVCLFPITLRELLEHNDALANEK